MRRVLLWAALVALVSTAPRSARAHYLDIVAIDSSGNPVLSCVDNLPVGTANCATVYWGMGTIDGCLPNGSLECCSLSDAIPCPTIGTQLLAVSMVARIVEMPDPTRADDCLCVPMGNVGACTQLLAGDPAALVRCAARDCDGDGLTNDVDSTMCLEENTGTLPPGSSAVLEGGGGCACAIGRTRPLGLAGFLLALLVGTTGMLRRRASSRRNDVTALTH